MREIEGQKAYASLRRNRTGWWARHTPDSPPAPTRTRKTLFLPPVEPRFGISLKDRVFTIGSCFARHIEKHLSQFGFEFETRNPKFYVAADECTSASGFFNKFTIPSMYNEVRWALGEADFPEDGYFEDDRSRWYDGQMPANYATRERAAAVRSNVSLVTSAVRQADVVIITLGLIECWFDHLVEQYLNTAPPASSIAAYKSRFSVRVLDYDQNLRFLEGIRTSVKAINPDVRFIVTVSPVPLAATFTSEDIAVANQHSKSTLRAVAGEFTARYMDTQYFPSYEIVTESHGLGAWMDDAVHVRPEMVGCVVAHFLRAFLAADEAATVDLEAAKQGLDRVIAEQGQLRVGEPRLGLQ